MSEYAQWVECWAGSLGWTAPDKETATQLLESVEQALRGPGATEDVSEGVRQILNRLAARHARALGPSPMRERRAHIESVTKGTFQNWLTVFRTAPLSLPLATSDELASLPEIGNILARRIVQHREERRGQTSVAALDALRGIGPAAMKVLTDQVVDEPTVEMPMHRELRELVTHPTFDALVSFMGTTSDATGEWIQNQLKRARIEARDLSPRIRHVLCASRPLDDSPKPLVPDVATGLLFDRDYLPFVEKAVHQSAGELSIAMFFARYDAERRSRVEGLLDRVVGASERGVKVRVILDQDKDGEVYRSRVINEGAYGRLKSSSADVRFDSPERVLHSKLVIVDDFTVIVGSHNWTGGSLLAYDDLSVVMHGAGLAQTYATRFDQLWSDGVELR